MKPNPMTETGRALAAVRDEGHHAARVVMVSTLVLFAFIFVLLAIAP